MPAPQESWVELYLRVKLSWQSADRTANLQISQRINPRRRHKIQLQTFIALQNTS